jgi:hypothetical protein
VRQPMIALATLAVLALTACSGQTNRASVPPDSGSGSFDASSETTSGGSCNGLTMPTCDNGVQSTSCCPAGAFCVAPPFCDLGDGACVLSMGAPCPDASTSDALGDGSCNGATLPECDNGVISTFCCPTGADCASQPFCDLGNGACVLSMGAPCPVDASTSDAHAATD